MKSITIKNSYDVWSVGMMTALINIECLRKYNVVDANKVLNRSYLSMCVEWYVHNIGYYITLPFVKHQHIKFLNKRCKDVDLEGY